jgi:hypothetical protein
MNKECELRLFTAAQPDIGMRRWNGLGYTLSRTQDKNHHILSIQYYRIV